MTTTEIVDALEKLIKHIEKAHSEFFDPLNLLPNPHQRQKDLLQELSKEAIILVFNIEVRLWRSIGVKDELQRLSQAFVSMHSPNYPDDILADLRRLILELKNPSPLQPDGVKYVRAGSREELRNILTTCTSGGGMSAWGHVDEGKTRLGQWLKKNRHPYATYLVGTQFDFHFAREWLRELEQEIDSQPKTKSFHNYIAFLDVVAYSQQIEEYQLAVVNALKNLVTECLDRHSAKLDEDVIALPTGDGVALCFIDSRPENLADFAIDLMDAIDSDPLKFEVRMGLHTQPDQTYVDINGRTNVVGAGINWAARVMNVAEGKQIVVSRTIAQQLESKGRFRGRLRSLGVQRVKHGKEEEMFELSRTLTS